MAVFCAAFSYPCVRRSVLAGSLDMVAYFAARVRKMLNMFLVSNFDELGKCRICCETRAVSYLYLDGFSFGPATRWRSVGDGVTISAVFVGAEFEMYSSSSSGCDTGVASYLLLDGFGFRPAACWRCVGDGVIISTDFIGAGFELHS